MDGLGQELLGLGDEAGQGVEADGGVAEPVGGAQPGELVDRFVEDLEAVVTGCSTPPSPAWPVRWAVMNASTSAGRT